MTHWFLIALVLFAPPAHAQALAPASTEAQGLIAKAVKGLEALPAIKGRFVQTGPDGQSVGGTFYLWRPGKLRFEYDSPSPLLVVADGYNVKVADRALKTVDSYPIGTTPLKVILSKTVRLDRDAKITRVSKTADGVTFSARDKKGEADGEISLLFDPQIKTLKEWTVTDGAGGRTRIQLVSYAPAKPEPALFVLRDPAKGGTRVGGKR